MKISFEIDDKDLFKVVRTYFPTIWPMSAQLAPKDVVNIVYDGVISSGARVVTSDLKWGSYCRVQPTN